MTRHLDRYDASVEPKTFTKTFDRPGDFAANGDAERWLAERGFSVGRMQRGAPRGILLGDYDIQKWRNLSLQDRAVLDGRLTGDGRNGPVVVTLFTHCAYVAALNVLAEA